MMVLQSNRNVARLDLILGFAALSPEVRALAVALVMAVLSPVMAELGAHAGGSEDGTEGGDAE